MKDYNKIESCLKSFLKNNKRLSYSIALLITFLINGGFSYADEAVQVPLRTEIKTRIEKEQENISQMLKEADESMKGIELKIKKLIQRGEFWVKPLEKSYQGFIFANWGNYSKNKNKTESNFNGPEYSASYGSSMGYGQFSNGKYYGEYGIVKNPLEFVDKIDFGANITPKAVAEKTIVEKTVVKKDITAPIVSPPTVEVGEITLTAPEEVTIGGMPAPKGPTPSISAPGAVPTLQGITVAAITAVNVTPSTPTVGEAPKINAPTVAAPATPAGFTPKLITPPEEPVVTLPKIKIPEEISYPGFGSSIQDVYDYWGGGNGATMIDQISITAGKFKATSGSGAYIQGYQGEGGYSATSSTLVKGTPTGTIPETNKFHSLARTYFFGIRNSAFMQWASGVEISWFGQGGSQLIYMETANQSQQNLDKLNAGGVLGADLYNRINSYKTLSGLKDNGDGANGINLHNNKGNIYLGNSETRYQATTTIGGTRLSVFNNEGTITGLNLTGGENGTDGKDGSKKQVVYFNTPDTGNDQRWIYGNGTNGKINLYGSEAIAMYFTSSGFNGSNGYQKYVRTAFVNDGEINLYGINSSGVVVNQNQKLRPESGIYLNKPVHLYADGARGLYIPGDISNLPAKNVIVRVKIGEKGNDTAGFNWTDIQTGNTKNIKSNGNFEGAEYSTDYVDNAIGVMYTNASANAKMQVPDITLEKYSKKGIGILALNGKLTVTNGNISIKGGIGNTALVAKKESAALPGGEIDYTGDINIGKSDIDNNVEAKEAMVAYAEGKDIKITGKVTVDSVDSVSIYSKNGKVTVEGDVLIKSKGKNVVAAYADNGTININRTTLSGKTDIDITGGIDKGKATGVALYAKDGGKINAQKLSLKVTNGSAGIVSVGKNTDSSSPESNIDFTGGKLEYNGNGYAVYSDGTGTVDLSNAELNLHGSSTAFDVDLGAATLPTKLNSGTKIKVHSDDVIAFNLKNAAGLTTVGGIETSIKGKIETKLGLGGGSLNNLFSGSTSTKYKVAAVDGGTLTVGDLDKSGTAADTAGAKKDGYEYFNRFLAQRLKATATGRTIKAVLDNNFANANFNGQVVGFEMNSSKNATDVDNTAINLVNSKIIADRTDAGAGAIGAFINYGEVNIDATSKIEVEKENNVVNKQAVGVYAVNGSKISNKGTIDVGGDQSVGILGMAYRVDNSNNPIVKEFGGKPDEGIVNITNEKNIKMSGKDAIGIYAVNNNTDPGETSHLVTNKGTVEVGDSAEKTAVGIYTKGVSVKPEGGTIKIGEKAVGIYAEDSKIGEAGKDLGTINFNGDNGVGIYLKGSGSQLLGNKVTLTESKDSKNKVGILADRGTSSIITTKVAVGNLNNVIAYYSKGNDEFNVQSDVTLNGNSIGISGEGDLKYGNGGNPYIMKLGKASTGVFGKKNISLEAGTNIQLNGENSVGAYASGASGIINSNGNIKFLKEKSIGLYAENGATVKDKTTMDFNDNDAKNNIGVYLAGAKWDIDTALTFNSTHEKGNIYLFAQGGSIATLKNVFNINPSTAPSGNNRTIGMYLDTAIKGGTGTADNTVDTSDNNAKISVTKGAIGIYAKNADDSKNNIINKIKVLSDAAVGVFADGNLKLSGNGGLIEAKNSGIGLYGNKGTINVEGPHKVEVTSAGTGMYLTNGSHLSGGTLELENKTAGTTAAGIYYTKGTNNDEVTHNTVLEVNSGSDLLALYADGGVKLNNANEIALTDGKNNVGAYITGSSIFRNKGKIISGGSGNNSIQNGIGVYVVDGEAINESGKTIDIYDLNNAAGLSVGMLANATAGKTAKVTNEGTINANGDTIGMVVEDGSEGENTGTITAKNIEDSGDVYKSIGAYINGANAKFTNSGTISAENIALALQGTGANKISNSGTLKLTKTGAVGVYAKDSVVDFNIAPTVAGGVDKTVALYAAGNSKIKSKITSASGKAHIGVYAEGNAEFLSGSKVTVGNGVDDDYGIGVYTKGGYNKTVNTDIELTGGKTIGFYLGATGGTGSTVTHNGTIDVGSGIGAYVPTNSKFVAQNTTFNVGNEGTAVYLKGGEADLGSTGTANINFTGSGRAVYQDGGTLTTGAGLHITGTGSFLTLKNANSIINSIVNVGENGIGINGIYDSNAQNYTLKLDSPTGHIKLSGNKATGIAAVAENTVASKKVDIINKGTIETISGEKTTGIYGKGANIENATGAKINIGAKGVGIYTTNDSSLENTTLNNAGEINLEGDEAVGIVAVKAKTNQDFVVGKITGTKNKLVGAYFKESLAATKVKDFDISLGDNAKGLVFDGGSDFTVTSSSTNKVKIGDTTGSSRGIGIAALGVNGTVSNTEVKVGKNSLGLYVKNKKLTFDLASGKLESSDASRSSILAYADGNNSEVALNGGGTLKVGANGIALGTKGGKITANAATTVEVDGVKGLGAYVENGGSISNNFDIKVKSAEGIGMYAKGGALASVAKVSELKGNKSIGYVFENITNAINMPNSVQLTDTNATGQVGVAVKGTGAGLTVAGVSVVGSKNIGIYNETTGAVTNNGALNVADSTGDSSIGIYSQGGTVTSTGNATIGKNSVGIYGKDAGAKLSGDMTVDEKGIGLYVDNDTTKPTVNTEITGKLEVGNNGTIGIQATNSNIKLGGDLTVGDNDSKGIFSKGAGNVETTGNINVGNNSVGIYKNGSGEIKTALGSIGKTLTVADSGYGVFSKGAKLINNMNLTVGVDAIGAYVDGNDLTSTGTVTVADKGVGLLVKGTGKTLTSIGNITVGSNNSVGLYAGDNANIAQSGNITVANNNGIGVYSKGSGNISTVGAMTVGKDSIGVYKDGKGTMNINASSPIQTMTIAEKGYGLYYKGNSRADSIINSNMNMTLGKEAVGIYAKNTTVNHTGNITVGETTIGSSGFTTPSDNKNSIGIFGDNANINFKGNMLVDKPLSVGIYGANGGSITVQSGSTITVKNGATGIMTGSKVENITLKSGSTLNVDGKVDTNVYTNATKSNVSFGIAAYSGLIDNQGTINVTNGATGIYLAGTASLKNGATGTINIDATSKSTAKPDTKASAELGGIKVTDKGVVTINNKVINGGTLNVKGALNMEGLGLDISTGKTVVDAKSISGVAEVLPSFSKGNSEQKVTIKDVFRTGVVGAFSGDVKSKSVSWIAKISKAPGSSTTTSDITMVRIPYNSLISGERYKNLASGLEDIRSKIGKDSSSPIFKSLDNISSHRDFARAVANIRGDVYSNIQERMKTVENSFDKSYNELLSSYNKTRNVDKFSVIYTGGEHKDSTLGVSGYEYKSTGVLYLNDREAFTYGGKYGWSAGIVGSNFEFNGDTNKGSKERVISGKLGLHYQTPLNKEDDNARLKWLTRGEITVNNHRTKRYSQVGADTYQNKASFYSTELSWKNIISYDYDINTNWTVKPYTGIDISYGHIFNIKEKNEGLPLEVKGKDYFVITPNVGVETKYVLPLGATHQVFAKADTEFSYDVTKLYHGVNQAKMKNTSTGYYDLSKPERRRARVAVGAELGLEKENAYGITFRAEYQGYKKSQLNYGVRLNYKF